MTKKHLETTKMDNMERWLWQEVAQLRQELEKVKQEMEQDRIWADRELAQQADRIDILRRKVLT